jgi:hypothetical protein
MFCCRKTTPELRKHAGRAIMKTVDLTWHNLNSTVLVDGPEITIRPVRIRRLPSEDAR